jgi:hypothetical protein
MPRFLIGTDDAVTARKMLALAEEAEAVEAAERPARTKSPAAALPVPHPGLPPAVPSVPQVAVSQPPAPPAPAPVAVAPPITPAAPPPSAPPPAAPAAAEPDAEDSAVLDAGWTLEHVKSTAQAYVKKHGNAGPGQIAALCAKYIPNVPKPTVSKVPAKYWPALHADLSA